MNSLGVVKRRKEKEFVFIVNLRPFSRLKRASFESPNTDLDQGTFTLQALKYRGLCMIIPLWNFGTLLSEGPAFRSSGKLMRRESVTNRWNRNLLSVGTLEGETRGTISLHQSPLLNYGLRFELWKVIIFFFKYEGQRERAEERDKNGGRKRVRGRRTEGKKGRKKGGKKRRWCRRKYRRKRKGK